MNLSVHLRVYDIYCIYVYILYVYYVYILYTVHIHDIHVYGAVVVSILVSNKVNVFSYFLSVCCIYVCYIISV